MRAVGVGAGGDGARAAFEPVFLVNGGATYTRGPHVTVGDGGWTPFFRPGVVVWDGGSIIAGHPSEPPYTFPAQTLSMVPRSCESFVSASSGARIDDMLEEGPTEVDARFQPEADLNVCLVLAGGGDFRAGVTATSMYESLREYCEQRHAAGFRVIVLTVLPCHRTDTFEVTRLVFNAMLRAGWDDFADGLVDLGADPRIGDTGDEYDAQFYLADQLHLTTAGNAVMASVAAPVLAAQPWLSARCELRLRDATGDWGEWRPWSATTSLWLGEYEGRHVVEAEYRLDGGEPVAMSDGIFLDTVRPWPQALRDSLRAPRQDGGPALQGGRRATLRADQHRGRGAQDEDGTPAQDVRAAPGADRLAGEGVVHVHAAQGLVPVAGACARHRRQPRHRAGRGPARRPLTPEGGARRRPLGRGDAERDAQRAAARSATFSGRRRGRRSSAGSPPPGSRRRGRPRRAPPRLVRCRGSAPS